MDARQQLSRWHTSLIRIAVLSVLSVALPVANRGYAQENLEEIERILGGIAWQEGPTNVLMGDVVELRVPSGYRFTGASGAASWMTVSGNQPASTLIGLLADDAGRFAMSFEFDPIGHVPDEERDQLDPDQILVMLQDGTNAGNVWRRQNRYPELTVTGWLVPPNYDRETQNLVWAIRGISSDGNPFVNLDTRILGRRGVLKIKAITDPNSFDVVEPLVRQLLPGIQFRSGERYSEIRPGDKVATYGLIGLISGAGTTAALKMGLFQKFGKLILLAIAALGGLGAWVWNTLHPQKSPPGVPSQPPKKR
ncbi:DUF2167 domain-containing protein [Planctomicrobium sp. SH527]|uniref:DUF2167 domain-containing protein n=1 Tax=Planctomicrobium sp. SH527 TaxID=3448123 RepID=UPI003F5C274D